MPLGDGNYLFLTVGAGQIWFTRRDLDGSWAPVEREQNPQLPGEAAAQAVSTQGTSELQHLAVVAFGGELWHSRWNSVGNATPFGDVQATGAGHAGAFLDVDATHGLATAGAGAELFVVGCTVDGNLWDTIRDPNGTWRPFENIRTVPGQIDIGPVRNVSCTTQPPDGSGSAFHVVALTSAYQLFHTRRDITTGAFSPFVDIESTAAGEAGNYVDVSCAWDGSSLHVCAVTGGTVKHTMLLADGTWTPFADVKTRSASDPGLVEKVACAPIGIPGRRPTVSTGCILAVPALVAEGFRRLTRRPEQNVRADAADEVTPTSVEVVVLTSAQRVFHTERDAAGGWTAFEDVESTAAGPIGSVGSRPRYLAL